MNLLTKAIKEKLYQNDQHVLETGESPEGVVVKLFNPAGAATWWIVSGTPLIDGEPTDDIDAADDWHLYGFATLGDARCAEFGYSLLSQHEAYKGPLGIGIERDIHFTGKIADVVREVKAVA